MVEVGIVFIFTVFVAGMFTFLAPCTLPLVPAFIGFISGVSIGEADNLDSASRKRMIVNTLFYILGFSLVFITLGVLAGLAGSLLAPVRIWLTRIGGLIVILFGLYLLGVFKSFGGQKKSVNVNKFVKKKGPIASLAFGASFGAGWSPCVGPIVGTVLLLTSTDGSVFTGALLLGVFSIGLGVPFLLTSIFLSRAASVLQKLERHLGWINKVAGVLILGFGLLLITNNLGILIALGYRAFGFLNYEEALLNFL